ncbi:hypothetical protein [Fodinicola acaciae]|uniref:hypothetical protein n=1 Tax=Fodinicola acaciae TaxID=2681555 RepID=UPI0013D4245C|nr:hypothetical protein [Fodinicola acaciae]
MKKLVLAAVAGAAIALAIGAPAPASAATTTSPEAVSPAAWPCGWFVVDGWGYWHNCDRIPHRVEVTHYDPPHERYICVDAGQIRKLGWVGGDFGGIIGASQAGNCPA